MIKISGGCAIIQVGMNAVTQLVFFINTRWVINAQNAVNIYTITRKRNRYSLEGIIFIKKKLLSLMISLIKCKNALK